MTVAGSDAAFELIGACVHSLRFAFGAPLAHPNAPTMPDAEGDAPEALFRRIQAASPPPTRGGAPWPTGMKLAGQPFEPDAGIQKLAEVVCDEGIASLDPAEPGTIVLDEWFRVEKREKVVEFPGVDHGRYMLSIGYWSPIPEGQASAQRTVKYFDDRYAMQWTRPVAVGDWVAVSFDAFFPPERDSADIIIPITECDCS